MKNDSRIQDKISRRRFAASVASTTLIASIDGLSRSQLARAQSTGRRPDSRPPSFAGAWLTDDATRQGYAKDYGAIVHEHPWAVAQPSTVQDVATTVRWARRQGLRIAARGMGHQPFGQAQVRDGIVIDMRTLRSVHAFTPERIEVDAGADWQSVLLAAADRHLTPPVLPAYLGLTVGGTLSIGGVGIATLHHGAQVDQVLELEVVTGEGDVVRCSEREQPELFAAALAGQGQCAIMTRAVLRLVPTPPRVREYFLPYEELAALLHDQQAIVRDRRFDGAVGLILRTERGWSYALQAIRRFTPPDEPRDAALTAGLHHVATAARVRDAGFVEHAQEVPGAPTAGSHADLGLLLPGDHVARFLGEALPRMTDADLGAATAMRLFLWNRSVFTRPLFRIPETDTCAYVATLRAPTTDPDAVARMLAGNRELFERNRELGGTLYPYAALELSRADWRRHYQSAWRALTHAKHRYDPDDIFASGPDLGRRGARD